MGYILILIGLFIITVFLERKFKIHIYNSRGERFLIPLLFFVVGVTWDTAAVINGHWYFNDANLLGIKIGVLPLEEYFFFLVIPYFIVVLYKILKQKIK
jgi:lycopene cyclase domain-containing protein